ncbi:hypothetical protein BDN72DRAFT_771819 [Pluteus cervinus]|uniref:Uncharacterized protein n=1 Tax=Pluteus cervinus TaxID=181527 RepID=A0ACD3ALH0_9AGAR|nr:hypothetical protein BDN72DRAFT_771819 [Pluteus cervinus]
MSSPIQFSVDDTSPTIDYQPFADTLSTPSLGLGWNPYYSISGFSNALGTIGQGQSFHVTSLNGASLTIHWHGTGIQLLGNVTDASFVIILDGRLNQSTTFDPSNNILATYQALPDADHNITLQVVTPPIQNPPDSHTLFFDKALIIAAPPPDTPPKYARFSSTRQRVIHRSLRTEFLHFFTFLLLPSQPTGLPFHSNP